MKILLVLAHPDDETFCLGGTIKLLSEKNTINLICATKGEAGLLGNPPAATKQNLGDVRSKELENAAKILGIQKIHFLGFKDGILKSRKKELYSKILKILVKENPDIVVTFDETGITNHTDHIAVGVATTQAFKEISKFSKKRLKLYHTVIPQSLIKHLYGTKYEYKAFGRIYGTPDNLITTKIDIERVLKYKIQAMKIHKTQSKDVDNYLKRGKDLNYEYLRLVFENFI